MGRQPRFGVVILTMGTRPDDLRRAVDSVQRQRGVVVDVVVVGNGWEPVGLPDGIKVLGLPNNAGIPAGRNAGVQCVGGELLFFLDDDASLPLDDTLARVAEQFAHTPALGLLQPRVEDPAGLPAPRRWVPRLRVGDPRHSSPAANVWEGAVALRREVFERVGGWPGEFFYAHEGIDLAWRVWDVGAAVWYSGDIVVHHPANEPTRHAFHYRYNARNRVWLARRNLPAPLVPVYLGVWVGLTVVRVRSLPALRAWFGGFWEGLRTSPEERAPMRWGTVRRMTLVGRPPII